MLRRMISGKLRVIFEDADLIVVNKPSNMLSVPGRELRITHDSPSRSEQWSAAVAAYADAAVPTSKAYDALQLLKGRGVVVPRAEGKFLKYLEKVAKVADPALAQQVWMELCSVDRQLNSIDLTTFPDHLISAADLIETHCSQRIHHVHRLDQETSGLLAFAKTNSAAAYIAQQFRDREASKVYIAMARRAPPCARGEVDLPLGPAAERPRQMVDLINGKPSQTEYEVLAAGSEEHAQCAQLFGTSQGVLLRLVPLTGRTHQLRVHMAALGCPLVQDSLYDESYEQEGGDLCLHAMQLTLRHPRSGDRVTFSSIVTN